MRPLGNLTAGKESDLPIFKGCRMSRYTAWGVNLWIWKVEVLLSSIEPPLTVTRRTAMVNGWPW